MKTSIKFFLGANSNKGFISYFGQLQDQKNDLRLLVLKGGPGSGKSTLMKRVCGYAEKKGNKIILIPCASDPDSLDSFIDVTDGFAMLDGTSPHVTDPVLPGVTDHIINMGEFWDIKKLQKRKKEISILTDYISQCHKDAGAYIKSAAALKEENVRHSKKFINKKEICDFSEEIIKTISSDEEGREYKALLSAVSVGKVVSFDETIASYDGIFAINDKWGAAADYLIKRIAGKMRIKGEKTIVCPSSIIPDISEHLLLYKNNTAFTTSKEFFNNPKAVTLKNLYKDIYGEEEMAEREKLHSFFLKKGAECVKKAKLLHDELEAHYKEAMDFSKIEDVYQKIIKTFY